MVKNIVKDVMFLGQKSSPATKEDLYIGQDLKDTLAAHHHECVGMAANMIGYRKNIIIVSFGIMDVVMYNPEIIKGQGKFKTEEGCLSLTGVRPCERYRKITVKYQDESFAWQTKEFSDFTAQIIQHECDHLKGIII